MSAKARLGLGFTDPTLRANGALGNALAIALFGLTAVGAASAWRARHGGRPPVTRRPS